MAKTTKTTKTRSASAPRTTRSRKPQTTPPPAVTHVAIAHDDIAFRAYQLFLDDGAIHGRDLDHWLRAEGELIERTRLNGS